MKNAKRRTRQTITKTRYILFNSRHHAVRLGEEEDLDKLQMEARSLHEVFGESYRIYDTKLQDNVYHWPLEEQRCRVCGCTWNDACQGGCHWVEENLCSQCVGQAGPEIREVG